MRASIAIRLGSCLDDLTFARVHFNCRDSLLLAAESEPHYRLFEDPKPITRASCFEVTVTQSRACRVQWLPLACVPRSPVLHSSLSGCGGLAAVRATTTVDFDSVAYGNDF